MTGIAAFVIVGSGDGIREHRPGINMSLPPQSGSYKHSRTHYPYLAFLFGMRFQNTLSKIFICLLFLVTLVIQAKAKNYYLSSKGNDNNGGTSPAQPWQTITRLNSNHLYPGDSVFFKGGDTLAGIIYVTALDSGTDAKPVIFSSYGNGRACINGGKGAAFYGYNAGGFTIENINFFGAGLSSNTNSGIVFYTDTSNGHKFNHIYIDNCNISGFGQCGILLGSYHSSYPGYQGIRITNVSINGVGTKGIFIYDYAGQNSTLYGHKNLYIGHCTVMYSGVEGILVSGVDSGLAEYCRAGYTGYNTNNGDAGIWAYSSNNITFQYCISDHATTSGSDGEGFDLDGGTQNCVVQYCYAYQNYACGFMHCDYPDSRPNYNNVIRYCISENDGRKAVDDESSFLFISWGTGIDHCYMYNNTAFISDNGTHPVSAFRGYILTGYASNPFITNCLALNNIMYVRGSNPNALVSLYNPNSTLDNSDILFAGNCYFSTNSQHWVNNGHSYASLRDWQDTTGQEMLNGIRKGYLINPGLQSPGNGGTVIDPDSLSFISAYRLKSNDPIIGRGLGIDTLFSLKIPLKDFYGDTLTPYHVYTMGADEPQPNKKPLAGFQFLNTCLGDSTIFTDASTGAVSWSWNFGDSTSGNTDYSTGSSPLHQYSKPGNYVVAQSVRSIYGYSDTIKKIVQIFPEPVAKFVAKNACANSPVYFSDSSLNAISYSWNFGDDSTSSVKNPTQVFNSPGIYTVSLKVVSSGSCSDSFKQTIDIYPDPVAKFDVTGKCLGDSFRFMDSSTGAVAWHWNFGDGDSSILQNPIHLYKITDTDSVVLITYSSEGCKDTMVKRVHVFPIPVSQFTAQNTCLGTPVQLSDSTAISQTVYLWNFGDTTVTDTGANHAHNFAFPGRYKVVLTSVTIMGCIDTFSQFIEVYPQPRPGLLYSVSNRILNAKAVDSTEPYYYWNFGDMDLSSGNYFVNHQYSNTGTYELTLTVKNAYGCVSRSDDSILVNNTGISPVDIGQNNFVNIFPNPVLDHAVLNYSLSQSTRVRITISSVDGTELKTLSDEFQSSGNQSIPINLSSLNLTAGIYFIKLVSGAQTANIKLLKL